MEIPRQHLIAIVARFGKGVCGDARLCRALLRDYCGDEYKREVFLLVAAVEDGSPAKLAAGAWSAPKEVVLAKLTDRLRDDYGVDIGLARWAIESWALALGVITTAEATPAAAPSPAAMGAAPTGGIGQRPTVPRSPQAAPPPPLPPPPLPPPLSPPAPVQAAASPPAPARSRLLAIGLACVAGLVGLILLVSQVIGRPPAPVPGAELTPPPARTPAQDTVSSSAGSALTPPAPGATVTPQPQAVNPGVSEASPSPPPRDKPATGDRGAPAPVGEPEPRHPFPAPDPVRQPGLDPPPDPAPPIATKPVAPTIDGFDAFPPSVQACATALLRWTVRGAYIVSISPGPSVDYKASDYAIVQPMRSTRYLLTAVGPGGTATQEFTLAVTGAASTGCGQR